MAQLSFVIAGVQKAGTTVLDAYLRKHPAIAMAKVKETHFFDNEEYTWRNPTYEELQEHFVGVAGNALKGESTPITLYWTPAHSRLFQHNSNIKIILLFREPAARAFSHWKMMRANGWESLCFHDVIRSGRIRILDEGCAYGLHRRYSYVERGYYGRQLQQLLKLFPRENVLALGSSELKVNPNATLERVAAFLDIPLFKKVELIELNVGNSAVEIEAADRAFLDNLYEFDQALFRSFFGLGEPFVY